MSWLSRRLDEDLGDEFRDHLERRAAALHSTGLSREEAQRQARVRFGNVTCLPEQSRTLRLWNWPDTTVQYVRYGWRGMCKAPVFATTAVLSLALAIGANTATHSTVDAAMLRPLGTLRTGCAAVFTQHAQPRNRIRFLCGVKVASITTGQARSFLQRAF